VPPKLPPKLPKRDFTGSEAVSLLLIFQGFDSYST